MATISPQEIAYQEAHIGENRGSSLVSVSAVLMVLCTFAVAGRVCARFLVKASFAADDYLIFISLVLFMGLGAENIIMAHYGLGKHAIALTPSMGLAVGKATFALELTYTFLMIFVKLSIFLLYRRILTMFNRTFRLGWWILICVSLVWFILTLLIDLLDCRPISANWATNANEQCRPPFTLALVSNIFNVVTDSLILLLPIPVVWNLQLPVKQRLATLGIFALGSFVVIVSCVRIKSLKAADNSDDGTYKGIPGFIWTVTEPGVAIICACLPTMTPVARAFSAKTRSLLSKQSQSSSTVWSSSALSGNKHGHQWSTIKGGDNDELPITKPSDETRITVQQDVELSSYARSDLSTARAESRRGL